MARCCNRVLEQRIERTNEIYKSYDDVVAEFFEDTVPQSVFMSVPIKVSNGDIQWYFKLYEEVSGIS